MKFGVKSRGVDDGAAVRGLGKRDAAARLALLTKKATKKPTKKAAKREKK